MEKAKQYIGFAAKAGRVACGAQAVESALRSHKAKLVVVDSAGSPNAKKKYMELCQIYGVPYYVMDDPCSMAGRYGRICLAVCDDKLAETIENEMLRESSGGRV
jgi:ribosomal protein L7Ae-like RNA K-turn-binding protein